MMHLYWLVLAMMVSLIPASDPIARHGALATAIATTLGERGPLFADDVTLSRSAALMVAVAYRESSLDNAAIGDHGRSVCAFQIHGGSRRLLEDPKACADVAYAMLRESIKRDPSRPVAFYARGPGFKSLEASRLSEDRVRLARRVLDGQAR